MSRICQFIITISANFLIVISAVFLIWFFPGFVRRANAAYWDNVSGWAWSQNIGWISFNCYNDYNGDGLRESHCTDAGYSADYGVNIDDQGVFSGYAWSNNFGWISFNQGELAGCPQGACRAQMDKQSGEVSGWAKLLVYTDGWIKLKGQAQDSSLYGVLVELDSANPDFREFKGWAWSQKTGWISFNCANQGACGVDYKAEISTIILGIPDQLGAKEGQAITEDMSNYAYFGDPGTVLSYSIIGVSPNYIDPMNPADINASTGAFLWLADDLQAGTTDQDPPNRDYYQDYTFTIQIQDQNGASYTDDFVVRVGDSNSKPELSDDTGASIEILEQAGAGNSFNIINNDADQDNIFIYSYSANPSLPNVDNPAYGISFTPGSPSASKNINFVWQPTINQAYYDTPGKHLQPYTFTFYVDDQRAAPYIDTHDVDIKIIDINQAPVFNMLWTDNVSENNTIDITIEARDDDYDYKRDKAEQFKFYLVSYKLNPQEIPNDGTAPLNPPQPGKLFIDGNEISADVLTGAGDPSRQSIINNDIIGPGDTCTDPLYRVDLEQLGSPVCSIQGAGIPGDPKYRICTQTLKLDLTDPAFNQFNHMGQHQLIFEAQDRLGPPDHPYTDGMGDDAAYTEDDPRCPKQTVGIQVANVNRAPNAPVPVFPNDVACTGLNPYPSPPYNPASGCSDHDLAIEPQYNPTNLVFEFTPAGDPDNLAHEDKIDYVLYIKKIGPLDQDPSFTRRQDVIILDLDADALDCIAKQGTVNCTITVTNLEPRTDYEWFIQAEDDAPCKEVTPGCTTLGVLSTQSQHIRFRTAIGQCNFAGSGGIECRKGEICVDTNNDGPITPDLCFNSNECNPSGVSCYLSACDIGETDDPSQGIGASCASSPSHRIFAKSQGKCRNSICDLPPAVPNTPEVCDGDGSNCQANDIPVANVDITPRLQWIDSDPGEDTWLDYKLDPVNYFGNRVKYEFIISNISASFNPTYTKNDSLDLDFKPIGDIDRFFSFESSLGGPFYLDFNEDYVWYLSADAEDPDPNLAVVSPSWEFLTMSVCDILGYSYWLNGVELQEPYKYHITNSLIAPDGPVPINAELKWPAQDYYIDNGILTSPSGQARYDLRLQECDLSGSNCNPIEPNIAVSGDWGYVAQDITDSFYNFNNAVLPLKPLNYDKIYIWQAVVHHGRFVDEIETPCPVNGNVFKTADPPNINLSKKIIDLQNNNITYQIDFKITGETWQRIKNFYIKDIYPWLADTAFQDTCNTNVDPYIGVCVTGAADTNDDTWRQEGAIDVKDPISLVIPDHDDPATPGFIEGKSWSDTDDNQWIQWTIEDSDVPDGSLGVGSSGSLVLTLKQYSGPLEFPECSLLVNQVFAGGISQRDDVLISAVPASTTHLAGSDIFDKSFISAQLGNIHSNLDICLQHSPSAADSYIVDYLITAKGNIDIPEGKESRAKEKLAESQYLKANFANIPSDIDYSKIELAVDIVHQGDCTAANLFGASPVALAGHVYYCKDDGTGTTGNLTIEPQAGSSGLIIANDGGSGTVLVDGDLIIQDDIYYNNNAIASIDDLAAIGWIVKGDIIIKEYPINQVSACDPYPESKWCAKYNLVIDPDGTGPILAYGPLTVGPDHIVGTFFAGEATKKIRTGHINLPLNVEGSLIANDVVLERLEFPD